MKQAGVAVLALVVAVATQTLARSQTSDGTSDESVVTIGVAGGDSVTGRFGGCSERVCVVFSEIGEVRVEIARIERIVFHRDGEESASEPDPLELLGLAGYTWSDDATPLSEAVDLNDLRVFLLYDDEVSRRNAQQLLMQRAVRYHWKVRLVESASESNLVIARVRGQDVRAEVSSSGGHSHQVTSTYLDIFDGKLHQAPTTVTTPLRIATTYTVDMYTGVFLVNHVSKSVQLIRADAGRGPAEGSKPFLWSRGTGTEVINEVLSLLRGR